MTPFWRFSSKNCLILAKSSGEYGLGRILIGSLSPVSIAKGAKLAGSPILRSRAGQEFLIQAVMRDTKFATILAYFLSLPFGFDSRLPAGSISSGRRR